MVGVKVTTFLALSGRGKLSNPHFAQSHMIIKTSANDESWKKHHHQMGNIHKVPFWCIYPSFELFCISFCS